MGDVDQPPNLLVFDLELAKAISGKGFATPWKAGVSVLCGWGLRDVSPFVWILDSARFPRVFLTEDHAVKVFERYDGVVTWNGLNFDDGVLAKCHPKIRKAYSRRSHVDLHAITCLLQAGVAVDRVTSGLKQGWASMVPTMREDLLNAGWSLDAVGEATIDTSKTDGPKGAEAARAWEQGRYSEVTSYCIGDVGLTRGLFLFAWMNGYLISKERGRVEIPRECLV
jgi:hypothetical protein